MVIRILFLICVALSSYANARSYEDIIESGQITIAVYNDFQPYSFLKDGEPAGVDIDVGKHIAKALDVNVEWLWLNADENLEDDLRNAIWKGHIITRQKADVMLRVPYDRRFAYAIDGYGLPKNEMVVMFSPYQQENWALLRDHEKTNDIRTLAIFQYEKIAVELDSLPSFFLGATIGGRLRDKLVHVDSVFAGIDKLKAGDVAAVAGMKAQLQWGMGPLTERYDISADGLAAMSIKSWDIGMAVKQDYRELAYTIESIIEPMVKNGEMEKLYLQYGLSYDIPDYFRTE
ncbi:amino acid ABC transporter substrate-binding protein [Aestuariibacter sp. GS-14]|uniref:substrate-binding periplasmic protein n=1 Tax=Aestuariibacter sp. GS-14 TaxID=2590670 RepID=UPI00112CD0AF|nr:transporter substrate-binding domain-containing protein [Aestuariibacter sp. GS-14]TPV54354.1 amino acid ABC transporter substrate-binding protein [Aestuariibacter sp. GS-14]